MTNEESRQNTNADCDKRNPRKSRELIVELLQLDRRRFGECRLNQIIKRTVPAINRHADLNLEVGREKDEGRAQN